MKGTVKFIGAILVALVVMLAFRSLVMTVCTVDGKGLEPVFQEGDRVVVNRWSYGLRTGEKGSLFDYGRICRQEVKKGDFIETIFFRPQDIQELVTEGYLWAVLKNLNARQKQLLFQKAILWCSPAEIGELRKQTDRNIRKVWNTLLNKLRKNALNDLRLKQKLGLPMMLEEKQFLSVNGKPAVSRRKRKTAP